MGPLRADVGHQRVDAADDAEEALARHAQPGAGERFGIEVPRIVLGCGGWALCGAVVTGSAGSGPAITVSRAEPGAFRPINEEIRELERRRMAEALAVVEGVKTKAAALIEMPIRTFTLKLKQYKL